MDLARVLIVACGNPLRSDDGVGWEIARALEADPLGPDVSVLTVHQLTPEISEEASRSDLLILIDASDEGCVAGSVATREVRDEGSSRMTYSHRLLLPELLELSAGLFGRVPRAITVSVALASTEPGVGLSDSVRAAIPVALAAVRNAVDEHRALYA